MKVCRDKYDDSLYDRIQKGFEKSRERERVGLSINPAETTIVAFTRKHKLDQSRYITIFVKEV